MATPSVHSDSSDLTDPNRRRNRRFRVCCALAVATASDESGVQEKRFGDRFAIARDLSLDGVLVGTPSRFTVGDRIELLFRAPGGPLDETHVRGEVVRVARNESDAAFVWSYLVAVRFEEPMLMSLESILESLEDKQS